MSFQSLPEPEARTLFDAWLRSSPPWLSLSVVHDAWRWADAASAMITACVELQAALWQPGWDVRSQWLQPWSAAWLAELPAARGGEHLA